MEEGSDDFLSNLPQEILQQILSLIPLKEALRTIILSTQWRSVWTPFIVNFELHHSNEITTKHLNKIMASFLNSHHTIPQLLKIFLVLPNKLKDELFLVATKGIHKDLRLDCSQRNNEFANFNLVLEPTKTAFLFSLKTIHLRSVTDISSDFVSVLFSNCTILESLELEKCRGMQSINVKANRHFERLIVVDCKELVSLTIFAPNLKTLIYKGFLPMIELKNTTELVDVTLNLKNFNGENELNCEDIISFLFSLKDVEVLAISGWLLEWLCEAGVIFCKLEFKFNKLKELRWIDTLMNQKKRDSLACFLNITSLLENLFIEIDGKCSPKQCQKFHECWHEPHLWMNYQMVKSNAYHLNHLRIVNFVGFRKQEDELLLIDLLLHKAIALKSLTVALSTDNSWWEVTKIPQSQLKKTTSSCYSKHMVVSSSTIDCCFVLISKIKFVVSRV